MDKLALFIGYVVLIFGGIGLAVLIVAWILSTVANLPLFRPKILKILKLGSSAWLKERDKMGKK